MAKHAKVTNCYSVLKSYGGSANKLFTFTFGATQSYIFNNFLFSPASFMVLITVSRLGSRPGLQTSSYFKIENQNPQLYSYNTDVKIALVRIFCVNMNTVS